MFLFTFCLCFLSVLCSKEFPLKPLCVAQKPQVCVRVCVCLSVCLCVCVCKGGRGRDVYLKCVKISDHSQESGCNSWDGLKIVYKIIPNIFFKFTEALPLDVNTVLTISQISITQKKGNKLLLICRIYKKTKIPGIRSGNAETSFRHHCCHDCFSKSFALLSIPDFTDYYSRYPVFLTGLIYCCDAGIRR